MSNAHLPIWQGNIASLSCSLEPNVRDTVFTRMPDRRMRERSFLDPIARVYQVADFKRVIRVRPDSVLPVTLPSGRVGELEPVRGNAFEVHVVLSRLRSRRAASRSVSSGC